MFTPLMGRHLALRSSTVEPGEEIPGQSGGRVDLRASSVLVPGGRSPSNGSRYVDTGALNDTDSHMCSADYDTLFCD